MKVIKKGKTPEERAWKREFDCTGYGNGNRGCGAVLEVQEDDIFTTYRSSMGRWECNFLTFRCPECGANTDIDNDDGAKEMPPHLWKKAPKGVRHKSEGWCHPSDPDRRSKRGTTA